MKRGIILTGKVLFDEAARLGLDPVPENHYGLFKILHGGKVFRFYYNALPFNNALSAQLATHKDLARSLLAEMGEKNIPYIFPETALELQQFQQKYVDIIAKPVKGSRSVGVRRFKSSTELAEYDWEDVLFEKYIDGQEYRYLVLDDEVLGVAEKTIEPTAENPWNKTWRVIDAGRWETPESMRAKKVLSFFGLRWGAVDFIRDNHGEFWIVEVNSAPGFVHFHHPDSGQPINIAKKVIDKVLRTTSGQPA